MHFIDCNFIRNRFLRYMANKMINDTIFETLNVIAINTLKDAKILLALLKYFFMLFQFMLYTLNAIPLIKNLTPFHSTRRNVSFDSIETVELFLIKSSIPG